MKAHSRTGCSLIAIQVICLSMNETTFQPKKKKKVRRKGTGRSKKGGKGLRVEWVLASLKLRVSNNGVLGVKSWSKRGARDR
jgi:fructose-1-phosphate kinase PfkB-like protein